jgi:hypothetical protein
VSTYVAKLCTLKVGVALVSGVIGASTAARNVIVARRLMLRRGGAVSAADAARAAEHGSAQVAVQVLERHRAHDVV